MIATVVAHTAATLLLAGMIWTIQVVHYPLFAQVGAEGFAAYEAAHSTRISTLIAVPWAAQGITTLVLLVSPPVGVPRPLVWLAATLAAVPVLVTVTMSVPAHQQLTTGFDAAAHARLVATNWLRTAAWTVGGAVALTMLVRAVEATRPA